MLVDHGGALMGHRTFNYDDAMRLHRAGWTVSQIAAHLKVRRTTVSHAIHSKYRSDHGISGTVSIFTPWVSTCRPELGIALPEPHRSEWQLAMAEWRAEG